MKTILLIRHGQSTMNSDQNRLSGITDVGLTAFGVKQCGSLSRFFDSREVCRIYSSPLIRAVESTKLIFPNHTDRIKISQYLLELNYGIFEGRVGDSTDDDDPILRQWNINPGNLSFPGGDNVADHAHRAYDGLISIGRESESGCVACVSHRSTIRLIVALVLGLDLDHFRRLPCDNGSVTEVEFAPPDRFFLKTLNFGAAHLL